MEVKSIRSGLKKVSVLRNLRQVRQFLGMSQSDLAEHVPSTWGTRLHIGKSMIAMIEAGERHLQKFQLDAVARLIATRLSNRYGREIGIRIVTNSPWKVTAHYWCPKCRQYHVLKTARQKCRRGR